MEGSDEGCVMNNVFLHLLALIFKFMILSLIYVTKLLPL